MWTPTVIFWSVIITWSVPTAITCPKPDGICHNTLDDGIVSASASYSDSQIFVKNCGILEIAH
jgi:hypothetical protein